MPRVLGFESRTLRTRDCSFIYVPDLYTYKTIGKEGSVSFERVRHPPMPLKSWELWEFLVFDCTVFTPSVPSFPSVHHSIRVPVLRANFVYTVRSASSSIHNHSSFVGYAMVFLRKRPCVLSRVLSDADCPPHDIFHMPCQYPRYYDSLYYPGSDSQECTRGSVH
jgi:hypothetical protein